MRTYLNVYEVIPVKNKQPKKKRRETSSLFLYIDLLFELILFVPRIMVAFFRSLF